MKKLVLFGFLIGTTVIFAQQNDSVLIQDEPELKEQVSRLTEEMEFRISEIAEILEENKALSKMLMSQESLIRSHKAIINNLGIELKSQSASIDSLSQSLQASRNSVAVLSKELGAEIEQTGKNADNQISILDGNLEKNRLYWIIATLVLLLLGGLMYLLLGKRIKSNKTDVESQIKNTKLALEEESVKLDKKLIDVLESQLKLKQEESKSHTPVSKNEEAHSLALKVADEIVRMQKNISRMDPETKGLKPLEKGIERIQNNFAANGYEMVNLLNKEYEDRMNLDVINFVEDVNLEKGKRIITKIIRPQVNFEGVLIQRAQVDVSQN